MRAITFVPGVAGDVEIVDLAEPAPSAGELLVETLRVGICGTDREILDGELGRPPPGEKRLVLGHEALGRVLSAPDESSLAPGDLVAPIVRRPDPAPCPNCAIGEWDMCRNGGFTEAGIRGLNGYARDRFALPVGFGVKVDPGLADIGVLVEPASVVVKAWEGILRIGSRTRWDPERVLVTGAGPIGLLAALIARSHSAQVHVLDRMVDGPKPDLVRDLGAIYHHDGLDRIDEEFDVVVECTGAPGLVVGVVGLCAANGVVCQTGVTADGEVTIDEGPMRRLVMENQAVFGSVNANRRHYEEAARLLANSDHAWLSRLITRRVRIDRATDAYTVTPGDVKTVIEFDTRFGAEI